MTRPFYFEPQSREPWRVARTEQNLRFALIALCWVFRLVDWGDFSAAEKSQRQAEWYAEDP